MPEIKHGNADKELLKMESSKEIWKYENVYLTNNHKEMFLLILKTLRVIRDLRLISDIFYATKILAKLDENKILSKRQNSNDFEWLRQAVGLKSAFVVQIVNDPGYLGTLNQDPGYIWQNSKNMLSLKWNLTWK